MVSHERRKVLPQQLTDSCQSTPCYLTIELCIVRGPNGGSSPARLLRVRFVVTAVQHVCGCAANMERAAGVRWAQDFSDATYDPKP